MARATDVAIQCPENGSVQYVFGTPSKESLDLLESLRKLQIRLVLTRHEQSAGSMAATYGRLTGGTGVSLPTLGLGTANLVTADAYAYPGDISMLMITGQKPVKESKQGRFQILDVVGMIQPLTKYTHQLASADNIPSRVRETFHLTKEKKPGAVRLELPEDIAAEQTDSLPIPPNPNRRPLTEYKAICTAIEELHVARSPILVIDAGASRKMIARALKQLIDKISIPFVTTQVGKGMVDERHSRFLGNIALPAGNFVRRTVEATDLIVNIGHDVIEKPPSFTVHGGTEVIRVNFRSVKVDPVYFPQIEVVGGIANAIWQIDEALDDTAHQDFTRLLAIRETGKAQVTEGADDSCFPLYSQRLVVDVRRALPSQDIAALDNGMYKIWLARSCKTRMPNTALLDNALAIMSADLPPAMVAHLVHPDRPIIAACGDGGLMMNSQGLEAAVRLKINLTMIILRDNGYGVIRWKQPNMGFADSGLGYGNPDFVRYVEAHGAHGHRVDSAEGFLPLLECCLDMPGVHVVGRPVDYSENGHTLNVELHERALAV